MMIALILCKDYIDYVCSFSVSLSRRIMYICVYFTRYRAPAAKHSEFIVLFQSFTFQLTLCVHSCVCACVSECLTLRQQYLIFYVHIFSSSIIVQCRFFLASACVCMFRLISFLTLINFIYVVVVFLMTLEECFLLPL